MHLRKREWSPYVNVLFEAYDLIHGVDIGYHGVRLQVRDSRNFVDTPAEEAAVSADIAAEVALGYIAGPFSISPYTSYVCSPMKTVFVKPSVMSAIRIRLLR